MSRVRGRVVVVTGASAGIGRETALRLARRGAVVVGAARDEERLAQVAAEAAAAAGTVEPVRCDVSVAADRAALVAGVVERHGRVDALVNNAGLGWQGHVAEMPLERVEYLFAVNVVGLVDLCRLVLPHMLAAGRGDIVNVSSLAGDVAFPPYAVYCATKHAVNGFTDGLRREVWLKGVRVHLVQPGPFRTEWIPRAAGYEPEAGAPEARFGAFPPEWVAAAIVRCIGRPFPRTVSVPRWGGAVRLAELVGVRRLSDVFWAMSGR